MGTYLKDNGYKPGQATWKFTTKDKVIYRSKNRHALRFYWDNRDRQSFKIEVRTNTPGWKFVKEHTPSDICICGRSYETSNGELFKFQENLIVLNVQNMIQLMCSPVLCQICYYSGEIQAGRWAPKSVKQALGLET